MTNSPQLVSKPSAAPSTSGAVLITKDTMAAAALQEPRDTSTDISTETPSSPEDASCTETEHHAHMDHSDTMSSSTPVTAKQEQTLERPAAPEEKTTGHTTTTTTTTTAEHPCHPPDSLLDSSDEADAPVATDANMQTSSTLPPLHPPAPKNDAHTGTHRSDSSPSPYPSPASAAAASSAATPCQPPEEEGRWWSKLLPSLFTTEQQAALEHDDPRTCDCKDLIFGTRLAPVPEHHTQLLDALQLGSTTESKGLFRTRLDHTFTAAGRHTLRKWLEYPLTNKTDIGLRRAMRVRLVGNSAMPLRKSLSHMEHHWASMSWCWSDEKSKTELVNNLLFGGVFAPFNHIPLVQNVYHHMCVSGAPLIHCLGPLMPVLLTYMMMRWMGAGMSFKECWNMSTGILKNTLWFDDGSGGGHGHNGHAGAGRMLGALFGSPSSLSAVVPALMKLLKWVWWIVFVANIVLMVYQCYRHYRLLSYVYSRVHRAASWLKTAREVATVPAADKPEVEQRISALVRWCTGASKSFSVFTNSHEFLHAYTVLRDVEVRAECERLLRQVGVIDALQSVDALLQRDTFTEPEALESAPGKAASTPSCTLRGAFHPLLSGTDQTRQDVSLDKQVVLTGINASGKSTVLKMLLLNVLLAQSWGVACAEHMTWTPFGNIRGYLHTVDDCGRESLFQAQVRRIEEFIEDARRLSAPAPPSSNGSPRDTISGHSLLVVDEILNSTNPIEAMLLSYQYARIIGKELGNSTRMIMTTHYPALTTLAKVHPTTFENWAMCPGYRVGVGATCQASSAIGTVRQMTRVLGDKEHVRLQKAYKRMYKRLVKMRFRELEDDA